MTVSEQPLFFRNGSYRLFGVLHRPRTEASGLGFVFCHPFAEEKLWTHRCFVSLARELADRGHAVLRFDEMGHGDSDGEFAHATVATRVADIRSALATLREQQPGLQRLGLLGLRFGATLAALAAEQEPDLDSLILWEPLLDGGSYMQEVLRSHLTTQMVLYGKILVNRKELLEQMQSGGTVNVDGYELTGVLHDQVAQIKLTEPPKSFAGRCLILQVSKDTGQPPRPDLQALAGSYPQAELVAAVEQPFWREIKQFYGRAANLTEATLSWLEETHA